VHQVVCWTGTVQQDNMYHARHIIATSWFEGGTAHI